MAAGILCLVLGATVLPGIVFAASEVRDPHVAGAFYPSDPKELSGMIDDFLAKAPNHEKLSGDVVAIIVPHAGYKYSGQVAAYAYKLLAGLKFDTVILLGPYHEEFFPGASIWSSGYWKTPLGRVPVDSALAKDILKGSSQFDFIPKAHLTEHSLEVQLPFLQKVLKDFKIVPVAVSDPFAENRRLLAEAIVKSIAHKKVLIIASTDLSHYYPDKVAREKDALTLDLVSKKDATALSRELYLNHAEMCGSAAVLALLEIANLLGNTEIEILKYATSGDVAEERERVVGYSAMVLYKKQPGGGTRDGTLDEKQQKELLRIARESVRNYVKDGKRLEILVNDPALEEPRAVFVTLRKRGALRGCIGRVLAEEPLYLAVRNMAIESAVSDSRFQPVGIEELADLTFEVSILSLPKKAKSPDEIRMGEDGVVLKSGGHSGVFLPKVAEETGWEKEEFLNELCSQKAGLAPDCWKDPATELYTFTAQDFGEMETVTLVKAKKD